MSAIVAGPGPAVERRRYARTKVIESQLLTVDVALGAPGRENRRQRGIVIDLGEGGIAVQPFLPLTQGTVGGLQIDFPGAAQSFSSTGMVAWVGRGGRAGIRFVGLSVDARAQLRQWLNRDAISPAQTTPGAVSAALAAAPPEASSTEFDFDVALRLIAARAQLIAAASGAAIAVGDSNGMVCRASVGTAPDVGVELRPHAGLSGYCLRSGQTVHCTDTQSDPRVDPSAARQLDLGSIIVIPVFAADRLSGLLEVLSPHSNAFDAHQVTRLDRLAVLLGGMIEEHQQVHRSPAVAPYVPESLPEPGTRDGDFHPRQFGIDSIERLAATAVPDRTIDPPSVAPPLFSAAADTPRTDSPATRPPATESPDAGLTGNTVPGGVIAKTAAEPPAATGPATSPESAVQLCDACGHLNLPGAIDCEQCDVPLPVALTIDRAERELETARFMAVRVERTVAAATASPPVSAEPYVPSFLGKPEAGTTDHHALRIPTLVSVILFVLLGALAGGWYMGRLHHRRIAVAVPLPPVKLPVTRVPVTLPASDSVSAPLAPAAVRETILQPAPGPGKAAAQTRPSPQPAISSVKSSTTLAPGGASARSGIGQPEVRVVLSSLSFAGPERRRNTRNGAQLLPGRLLHKADPVYPAQAIAARISGEVVVMATIAMKGTMENVKVVSGPEPLRAAAVDAVRQWRYQPWQLDGAPVDVQTTMTVTFLLPE